MRQIVRDNAEVWKEITDIKIKLIFGDIDRLQEKVVAIVKSTPIQRFIYPKIWISVI